MKKIFRNIGITTIICISFLISEKTAIVVKDVDNILMELKQIEKEYYIKPQNAIIKNKTMIPGIYGKKINIEKTYKEIKKIGQINENYFIYDYIKPEISIEKRYDKYIIKGNDKNKSISIVFIVKNNDDINKILKIIEQEQIKVNFFLEDNWIKKNNEMINKIIKKGNKIEKLYSDESQNVNIHSKNFNEEFCYTENENEKLLNKCKNENKYTIKQKIISKKNPLTEIKKQITNGSIVVLTVDDKVNQELELIIKYIKSKGYEIVKLEQLLSEKNG